MTEQPLRRELAAIVGDAHVLTERVDRLAYNNDCWPRGVIMARGRQLTRHMPAAIVQPASVEEVQSIVQWARRAGMPIVPYGAGSGVCGGTVVEQDQGVIVDLKRLKSIVATSKHDMTMRVQSGIIGMNMERELQRRGLTLGHYPSSLICSSLGGYLAARSAGQYSSRYGKIEDMVASLRMVTGTGELVDTGADALAAVPSSGVGNGLDLTQLIVGSEGTFGLITDATLHLQPHPTRRMYAGFHFDGVEEALDGVRHLMQQGLRPAVVRLYDEFDTFIAKRGKKPKDEKNALPEKLLAQVSEWIEGVVPVEAAPIKQQMQGTIDAITRGLLGRVLGQPFLLNKLIENMPYACLLVVGFEGDGPGVANEANYAFDYLGQRGRYLGPEAGEHWYENRFSVSYKQSAMYVAGAFIDTMEVSTTWDNLSNLYWNVREALAEHVLVMAHFSHVYPEGSSIYFTFAGYGSDLDDTLARYEATWDAGLKAVAKAGASTAHHHGVGQSKAMWSGHDHVGGQALFEHFKGVFDPDGIMNPGKVYIGGDRG